MATGFQRSSDRPRGRSVAARQLQEFMLGDTDAARDWSEAPDRFTPRERGIDELITEFGGTKGLAEATGRSQRQIQRWRQTGTSNLTASSRTALDHANNTLNAKERREHGRREWGEIAERFGGTRGLARTIGVHQRTVQSWMAGSSVPSDKNLAALHRADRGYRIAQTYGNLDVDPGSGKPSGRVHMKASGMVRAQGTGGTPLYQFNRNIGIASLDEAGHELPPDVAGDMFTAMRNGDSTGALDVLQQHLSGAREGDPWSYAQCGAYSVEDDIGFFVDDFTDLQFN